MKSRQQIKQHARRTLNKNFSQQKKTYVVDTSVIINKFLPKLMHKGLKGKIIIPNAVMAELENQANKGFETGFIGLEEVAKLHRLKSNSNIVVFFEGIRPQEMHIKYAKSGEIDALIREIAIKNKASMITADLVQAKTAQAYGLEVIFLRPKPEEKEKKTFFSFFKKRR
ncbi:MAG: PIN domain-containing protein [Nanoarchaeota archaeon]